MIFFISGTDTDVGKTFICAAISLYLKKQGIHFGVQKWVSTGDSKRCPDLEFISNTVGKDSPIEKDFVPYSIRCPYKFSLPASPHLAAQIDKKSVDPEVIRVATKQYLTFCDVLLIEGAGGLMVPLTEELLTIDLIKEMNLPIILVARASLGTINHSLLSIEACKSRGIEIIGLILNQADDLEDTIIKDNKRIISRLSHIDVFGPIPKVNSPEDALPFLTELFSKMRKIIN